MASVAYDLLHKVAPVVAEQFIFQNASTTQNELYGDLNMDHLNWLEKKWAGYYIWMGNALLATGVMSFVMHEVSSFSVHEIEIELMTACLLRTSYPLVNR
jgi:methylsterol monooxygenase